MDVLKKKYQKAFKTITLRAGSLAGCLHHATCLSKANAHTVADQVNIAATVMSDAHIIALKCMELWLLKELEHITPGMKKEQTHSWQDPKHKFNLILNHANGQTIFNNLLHLALDGKCTNHSPGVSNNDTIQCQEIVNEAYQLMKSCAPSLQPVTKKWLASVSVAQEEVAKEVSQDMRRHFNMLPSLIAAKVFFFTLTNKKSCMFTLSFLIVNNHCLLHCF